MNAEEVLQELINAVWNTGRIGYGDHSELESALGKAEMFLARGVAGTCSEFITEENLINNPEPCVPGNWHCQLPTGHDGLHQHTHTCKWNSG